jgi:hypothetical protein
MRFISVATWRRPISTPSPVQQVAQHPAARERVIQMQLVDPRMIARGLGDTGRGL